MPHVIPPMTDPLGQYWTQPSPRDIQVDDQHALMSQVILNALSEYSHSTPTGVYPGKMWKMLQHGEWWLRWFGVSEQGPDFCSNHARKILII